MEHLIWILREGRIPCLFHELTGFYCPGCGGTRAVLALLAGHPVLSFLYHPLVPYCALVALVFAVSYAIYWKTKDPRFRLYLSDAYVHVGLGIIVVNFLVKNYLLAAKGIDILEQLPLVGSRSPSGCLEPLRAYTVGRDWPCCCSCCSSCSMNSLIRAALAGSFTRLERAIK